MNVTPSIESLAEKLVPAEKLMEILGVRDRKTIRAWVKQGMPEIRFGYRTVRYDPDACVEWAASRGAGGDVKVKKLEVLETGEVRVVGAEVRRVEPVLYDPDIDAFLSSVAAPERKKKPTVKEAYSDEFETFWSVYPRKIGKKVAYSAWKTNLKAGKTAEDMVQAAGNYAAQCRRRKTEEQYILHPSTFLNKDRFEDYLKPGAESYGKQHVGSGGSGAGGSEADALSL